MSADGGAVHARVAIVNKKGLHARASARFVTEAERFEADIRVSRDGLTVSGRSIMGLLMLAAAMGAEIDIAAVGSDADAALEALSTLVADRFGEGA